jgi:hypothetical protein
MSSFNVWKDIYNRLRNAKLLLGSDNIVPMITKARGVTTDEASLLVRKSISISTTETILVSLKNQSANRTIVLSTLTLHDLGNKSMDIAIYKNGITGATFNQWCINKIGHIATDGTLNLTSNTVSGITKIEEQVDSNILAKDEKERINLHDGDIQIEASPNDIITITATAIGGATTATINLRWRTL